MLDIPSYPELPQEYPNSFATNVLLYGMFGLMVAIAIPLSIVTAIFISGELALLIFVASIVACPVCWVIFNIQLSRRKAAYINYSSHGYFINNLYHFVFTPHKTVGSPDPAMLTPEAHARYTTILNAMKNLGGIKPEKFNPAIFAEWEPKFFELLHLIDPKLPSLTAHERNDYPSQLAAELKNQGASYIPNVIARVAAYQAFLTAINYFLLNHISGSMTEHLSNQWRAIADAWGTTQQELRNVSHMHLNHPPASTPAHALETFYRPQIHEFFYGQWKHLKDYRQDMRYTIADLSPDVETYDRAMQAASAQHPAFATVAQHPAHWLDQFHALYDPMLAEFNDYLATSGQFIVGTTATAQQPDINTAPPYAITLTPSERRTHTYVIGRTGSGKTTLLKNLITQDLRNNQQGVVVLSPENKIFEDLLDLVPPERAHSLIYFDPTDTRPPVIGFNPFTFEDGDDLNQKAQETYTIFERALGDLGVKMTTMLQNAAYALIQRKNSRLIDLDTLLNPSNNSLRHRVARDPAIDERTRNFWQSYDNSAYYKSAYEPVVNRLDPFFRPPHATILSTNSFSWDEVLNAKPHIIFCNLSRLKGVEAQIMGQLLIAQIQQTIFHRDPKPESSYIPYALYIDEFQTYATTGEQSFIETLNKARKYHFALTLAHQVTSDIPPKLLSSIVGNVGTVIALRTSAEDAPFFAKDLQIKDAEGHSRPDLLQNLPIGQAIVRTPSHNIGIAIGVPAAPPPLQRDTPAPSLPRLADTYAATLKTLSKRNFGTQPTQSLQPPDNVPQQPISDATAPLEVDDRTAAAVIAAPEPAPNSADPGTIVIDETENPLTRTTRRRGRPPRSTTANPPPVPSRRRRIILDGDNNPE